MEATISGEIIDFYQILLTQQSKNFSALITVLVAITTLLLGGTWLWNFLLAKKQIANEVKKRVDKSTKKLDKIINKKVKGEKKLIEKLLSEKLIDIEADLARNYANMAEDKKLYYVAFNWWVIALNLYIKIESNRYIGVATKAIHSIISNNNIAWKKQIKDGEEDLSFHFKVVKKIPETLFSEKRLILKEVKKLCKKD